MYYSNLFISDSQSMTVECSMLGVPNIRFNDFVGKISVLEELEKKYDLTYGINSNNIIKLFKKSIDLIKTNNYKLKFAKNRERMLSEKIDVTEFIFNFIQKFDSKKELA